MAFTARRRKELWGMAAAFNDPSEIDKMYPEPSKKQGYGFADHVKRSQRG